MGVHNELGTRSNISQCANNCVRFVYKVVKRKGSYIKRAVPELCGFGEKAAFKQQINATAEGNTL